MHVTRVFFVYLAPEKYESSLMQNAIFVIHFTFVLSLLKIIIIISVHRFQTERPTSTNVLWSNVLAPGLLELALNGLSDLFYLLQVLDDHRLLGTWQSTPTIGEDGFLQTNGRVLTPDLMGMITALNLKRLMFEHVLHVSVDLHPRCTPFFEANKVWEMDYDGWPIN